LQKKLFRQVWRNSGKIFRIPKNLLAAPSMCGGEISCKPQTWFRSWR